MGGDVRSSAPFNRLKIFPWLFTFGIPAAVRVARFTEKLQIFKYKPERCKRRMNSKIPVTRFVKLSAYRFNETSCLFRSREKQTGVHLVVASSAKGMRSGIEFIVSRILHLIFVMNSPFSSIVFQ